MSKFTYIELFAGIGGFGTALNRMGGECVFASEIDKFASKAYETLYGGEVLHGDITKVDEKDIPNHDILTAGTPCQSFSVAGKRKGFDDTRGTLFFDVARIAKEKQPKVVWIENVKGLVNHDKGRTLDVMIETLNEIGYVVDFDVLNSKYFGVPQNRERIFIVAIREDLIEAEPFSEESTTGQTIVPKGKRRIGEWADVFNFYWPEQNEVSTRLRDILESNVDEKYYLDEDKTDKLVAQLEEKERSKDETEPEKIAGLWGARQAGSMWDVDKIAPTLKTSSGGYSEPLIEDTPQMLGHVDIKGNDSIKRTYSTEGISPTLTTMGGGHREPKIAEEQGLPIREATKKGYAIAEEGDSVNVQFPDSKTRRGRVGKQIANTLEASSINQGVVEAEEVRPVLTPDRMEKRQNGRRFKEYGEESFTLTSQDRHGVALREIIEENVREIASKSRPNEEIKINFKENGDIRPHRTDARKSGLSELNINHEDNPSFTVSAAHSPKVYGNKTRYRIRKLTPLECWRLQGFPDEAHEAVKQAGLSDSQRYKQAGNAVTVNVIEAIAERLIPLIAS